MALIFAIEIVRKIKGKLTNPDDEYTNTKS